MIRKLQSDAKQMNWNEKTVFSNISLYGFLRKLTASLKNVELFYFSEGLLIDRLASSEYNQTGRDFVEELLLSSYADEVPNLGYFNAFRMYSNIRNIHAAFIYANLCFVCTLKNNPPYSDRSIREIVWQSIKFFRNVKLHKLVGEIYHNIPENLNFTPYERRSIDHSYFTALLHEQDQSLPSRLLDYLRKERENILAGGINDAQPWLVTLYNVKKIYPLADFSANGFGFFLATFEMIVPPQQVKKYKDVIEAKTEDLKKHLIESLVKLNETRNTADFVYDNKNALMISEQLIVYSDKMQDTSAFLIAMLLKSDFSILFQEREHSELVQLTMPEVNVDDLETFYDDFDTFLKALSLDPKVSMNWLAIAEENLYQLQLINGVSSFHPSITWDRTVYKNTLDADYFANLKFEDTKNSRGGVIQKFKEDHDINEQKIAQDLIFAQISVRENTNEVYVVMDMELTKYPHNLLLDETGDFVAKHIPVTNVLSTEWLLQKSKDARLPNNCKKSAWIPTESRDNDLYWLYGNIEDTLKEFNFDIYQHTKLQTPLSADINIICSHGAKNISDTQIISQEGHFNYDVGKIIGQGKVLIFFVCYSGTMKTEFFRNDVTSLIKRFIASGYEAVIAPGWALDVTVPRYWLPEFLRSFESGETISQAVFNANKNVYDRYPTPEAWGCLHLYGNPNLTLEIS